MAAETSSERIKVLLLMLSLFSLTCAATTLIDDDDLKELKDNIQTFKRETQRKRVSSMVDSAFLPDFVDEMGNLMDLLSESFEITVEFPPLLDVMQDLKVLIKEVKIDLELFLRNQESKIRDNEEKLRHMEKLIMALEEWRS